jgi:hypothetical protein
MSTPGDFPTYVYTFRGADCVLYVGYTSNLASRLQNHQTKHWWSEVESVDVEKYPTMAAGMAAEKLRIAELNPIHNRAFTDHDTPKRNPCARCRTGRHRDCLKVNGHGQPCPCLQCAADRVGVGAA